MPHYTRFLEIAMEVILKEDVNNLGHRGDVVKVADGYGRNFLLPKKLALEANAANKAVIEQMKASAVRKSAKEKTEAEALVAQLDALSLSFKRKVGENDHLFGSVTSAGHRSAAREQGICNRSPQAAVGRAAQVPGRVPRPSEAPPRGHRSPQGERGSRRRSGGVVSAVAVARTVARLNIEAYLRVQPGTVGLCISPTKFSVCV